MKFFWHLKALLRKNWLIWRRNYVGLLLETLVPILCATLFLACRYAAPIINMPQTTYYNSQAFPFFSPAINNGLMKNCNSDRNGGKIALAPQTDPIVLELKTVLQSIVPVDSRLTHLLDFGHDVELFQDNQAIDDFTQLDSYGSENQRLCFAVVLLNNNLNGKYQYTLRYNISQLTGYEDIPSTNDDRISEINQDEILTLQKYASSGFLTVQNWLDNLILQKETGNPLAQITATVSSVTVPAYKNDDLLDVLKSVIQYLVVVPLLLPFLRLTDGVLKEKEKRIREGMKIMGLEGATFYLSWWILYAGVMTFISIFTALILKFGFFKNSSFGPLFLWYWEYAVCSVSLGILVTVFFDKAKIGNIAGFVLLFMLQWVGQFVANSDVSETARFWASIAPPISVSLAGNQLVTLEASQLGLTSETMSALYFSYRTVYHYMWMAIGTVVFLLLSLYLDQVLPSEFGIRKHPFFLCIKKRRKSNIVQPESQQKVEALLNNENFEDVEPALKTQDERGESIVIKNLYKKYKNGKIAVDHVNYHMYSGQIFALLGHNGAGKTSTISMLTGLYAATEGSISIFGMDIERDLESIRKIMGVCPQHDVLFDDLTVKEHLELFATFKGVDSKTAPIEIEKLINDLDLYEKCNERSKNLSGGQKRRLSVAIAFLGGSKFILLDEPSSGMDTSARRRLWDMLKNYKHGRVIVLTTHFMDEADYLGDRIGIMGEGKMQCLGSTLFLKNRFGVGYTLTLSKKDATQNSQNIISFIQNHIQDSKVVSNVSSEIILQLPMDSVSKFKSLFNDLDDQLDELNIESYGISVTTLEQVFLNVANLLKRDSNKPQAKKILPDHLTNEFANFDLRKERIPSAFQIFAHQFYALVKKRLLCFKRDPMSITLELCLPVIMIIIGVALIKINTIAPPKALYLSDNLYGAPFDVRYNTILPSGSSLDPDIITTLNSDDTYNVIGVSVNNLESFDAQIFKNRKDDPMSIFNVFFDTLDKAGKSFSYFTEVDTRAQESGPYAINKINSALLKYATNNPSNEIELSIIPFMNPKNSDTVRNSLDGLGITFIFAIGMSFIPASIITFIVKERESTVKHQQLVSGISIQAYWFANYFVDIIKYMIPAVINVFMAVVFDAQGLIQGEKYSVLWALFMSYGFSVISFVYLTSFFFKDYSVAQTTTFFFNFGIGLIGGLAVGMLRIFDLTNKISRMEQWLFRLFPTFSLTYGLLELTNQEIYQKVEGDPFLRSPWKLDLSGGDFLYMVITAFVYFVLVFVVEFFKAKKIFSNRVPKAFIPKNPIYLDSDVEEEAKRIERSSKNDYSVKIDKLCKVYKTSSSGKYKTATNQISFGVKNGECFALLGVNGAGKTTTFKMLSGDVRPTSGQAVINGFNIPSEIRQAQHDIGYCPQNDPLLEYLTAREHLYLFAAIRGIPTLKRKRMIENILQEVNLTGFADVVSGAYSGGNKRKLCVAIAMIGNPPIVFLDEPSSGMDPEARRFMWEAISRISKERQRSSVILTTHSMEEAEALSTRMCIMVNGVMRCLGSTQHIKNKYGGGYEMEVKLNLLKKSEILDSIKATDFEENEFLTRDQVYQVLETYGVAELASQISEEGTGSPVHMEIIKRDKVSIQLVIDWILTEKRGKILMDFLKHNFHDVVLIEHFQSFYRFSIKSAISIGQIFGKIEENKLDLDIMQYSVRQSTIEQIFNTFAVTQENPILLPPLLEVKPQSPKILDRSIPDEFTLEIGQINTNTNLPVTQLELA